MRGKRDKEFRECFFFVSFFKEVQLSEPNENYGKAVCRHNGEQIEIP